MTDLLEPRTMRAILTHDRTYQRAVKVLREDWDLDAQSLFHNRIQASDVRFARLLQKAQLVTGTVNLMDYQAVNELMMRHEQWFSAGARSALVRPFQE